MFGSPELYAGVHRNERVRLLRTEKTNDPALIKLHHRMVSVNTALQVDLFGQANASRIGRRIYSGTASVEVPLFGGRAERGIATEIGHALTVAAVTTQAWLDARAS